MDIYNNDQFLDLSSQYEYQENSQGLFHFIATDQDRRNSTYEDNMNNDLQVQNGERPMTKNEIVNNQNFFNRNETPLTQNQTNENNKKKNRTLKPEIESILPGESKNLSKCYGRQLQQFIQNVIRNTKDSKLKQLIEDKDIQQFLSINPDKIRKFDLNQFVNSPKGRIFSKEFFDQCLWAIGIVKESKTHVNPLFRYNIEIFCETIKKQIKINE
ncbi:unnamed protein product [Paramecium sonneborni]|uniref:Uncharacterized protein n=1 Tax=Paramecium sonneborni TaxID=65129 RepID=A0A8S1MVT9_9CILI|nr:unnamed protein product [Paramecium sonneborni]